MDPIIEAAMIRLRGELIPEGWQATASDSLVFGPAPGDAQIKACENWIRLFGMAGPVSQRTYKIRRSGTISVPSILACARKTADKLRPALAAQAAETEKRKRSKERIRAAEAEKRKQCQERVQAAIGDLVKIKSVNWLTGTRMLVLADDLQLLIDADEELLVFDLIGVQILPYRPADDYRVPEETLEALSRLQDKLQSIMKRLGRVPEAEEVEEEQAAAPAPTPPPIPEPPVPVVLKQTGLFGSADRSKEGGTDG